MARQARIFMLLQGPSGDLRGESEVVPMQGWIELEDWRWQLDAGSRHADREAVQAIFSDPDKFVTAAPFLFLLAALVVLTFGAGRLSLDAWFFRKDHASSAERPKN